MCLLVEAVENGDLDIPSFDDESLQVSNGVALGEAVSDDTIELSLWMEEVVVGVDEEDCGLGGHLGAGYVSSMDIQKARFGARPRSFCRSIDNPATSWSLPE